MPHSHTPPNTEEIVTPAKEATAETPSLEQKVIELETLIAELKDQSLRAKAETENVRRRAAEEVQAASKYAIGKFAAELIPVKDCLEMALLDQSGQFDTLKMGVDMTLKQLVVAFEKFQLCEIHPEGEKLDPHRHQAVSAVESDAEPNTVVQVMQKGYVLGERILRPAMVVVAKAKA